MESLWESKRSLLGGIRSGTHGSMKQAKKWAIFRASAKSIRSQNDHDKAMEDNNRVPVSGRLHKQNSMTQWQSFHYFSSGHVTGALTA
jgi:hypothetical protein